MAGAVPATVGVARREGCASAWTEAELERFDLAGPARPGRETSAPALWPGRLGATTVGGTLAVCRAAGIGFMAPGGIGGVHRGLQHPPDISADLGELGPDGGARRGVGREVAPRRGRDRGGAGDAWRARARLRARTRCRSSTGGRRPARLAARAERATRRRRSRGPTGASAGAPGSACAAVPTSRQDVEPLIEKGTLEAAARRASAARRSRRSSSPICTRRAAAGPRGEQRADRRERRPRRRDRHRVLVADWLRVDSFDGDDVAASNAPQRRGPPTMSPLGRTPPAESTAVVGRRHRG